jgi:hypothetical protein
MDRAPKPSDLSPRNPTKLKATVVRGSRFPKQDSLNPKEPRAKSKQEHISTKKQESAKP